MLFAVDPGLNSPGIAAFCDEGMLVRATRIKVPDLVGAPDGARWLEVANLLCAFVGKHTGPHRDVTVVFERPQFYTRDKSKGDPNKLVGVTGVAACLVGLLSCRFRPLEVCSPTPAEWIGQLPKTCPTCRANKKKCPACLGSAWLTPRGRRIRSRLSPVELELVPDQNDAIDAVGLGLWKLGRLKPHSVFSNGSDGR